MRVLHVGAGNLHGGVESMLVAVARSRAAADGVEHEFSLFFDGRVARELRAEGAPVHRLPEVRTRRPWTIWWARRKLARLLESRRIDVVLAHGFWCLAVAAPAVRRAGRRLALFAHDRVGSGHWIERWAGLTTPDVVVSNSAFTGSTLERRFGGVTSHVVHCPVTPPARGFDGAARASRRRALGASDGDAVIVIAARLEAWKGHRVLIKALGGLRSVPGWRCWVAGGAQRDEERALHHELMRLGVSCEVADRISWLGQRDDVPALLAAGDVYCQPNTGPEPFGIAFIEALQAGLPVVSTAIGGALEIVDGSCGVLVPPGDAAALTEALRALVTSAERRAALAARAPARARLLCDPATQVRRLSLVLAGIEAAS
jgi:glycosyltransferase involved in cell wall biosynthesis